MPFKRPRNGDAGLPNTPPCVWEQGTWPIFHSCARSCDNSALRGLRMLFGPLGELQYLAGEQNAIATTMSLECV